MSYLFEKFRVTVYRDKVQFHLANVQQRSKVSLAEYFPKIGGDKV